MNSNMLDQFAKNGEAYAKASTEGNKKLMRIRCQDIYANLDETYFCDASKEIYKKVLKSEIYHKAKVIFCYISTENEPDTKEFLQKAFSDNKRIAVPLCVDSNSMVAKEYKKGDSLEKGRFNIYEPQLSSRTIEKDLIDLAIIPCMACDKYGRRLGHGLGFYDRFLEKMNGYKMALCFEKLIMGNVPWYKTDIIMDCVITENEIYGKQWKDKQGKNEYILPLR